MLVSEITYSKEDTVIRDWRGKVELVSCSHGLLTIDGNDVNPLCPINIARSARYILPVEQSTVLYESIVEFMKSERSTIDKKRVEKCARSISSDKLAGNKMGRILSEEWRGYRRRLKEDFFDLLGYRALGSKCEKCTKKNGVSDAWKHTAMEASGKLLKYNGEKEDLSYWRTADFKNICSDRVADEGEPETCFVEDSLFKNAAAKKSFSTFLRPEIDGLKVSKESACSVITLARADSWITTNLVMMSGKKVVMDGKELSGVAGFKFLFRSLIQRAVLNIMTETRKIIELLFRDELSLVTNSSENHADLYRQIRVGTVVIFSQNWKRNFLLVNASCWAKDVSPLMGPTIDGFIGVEGEDSFAPINADISIADDSSVEGSVLSDDEDRIHDNDNENSQGEE